MTTTKYRRQNKRPRFNRRDDAVGTDPWRFVVLAAATAFFFIEAGVAKSLGVLVPSLVLALDSDYATIGIIISMPWSIQYVSTVFIHHLSKRFGATKVAAMGGLMTGVAMAAAAFVRSTQSLCLLFSLVGLGESMILVLIPTCLHQHFGPRFPSVFSFVLVGTLVGSIVMPLITEILYSTFGEKGALFVLGGVYLNLFPVALVLKPPRHHVGSAAEVPVDEVGRAAKNVERFEAPENGVLLVRSNEIIGDSGTEIREVARCIFPKNGTGSLTNSKYRNGVANTSAEIAVKNSGENLYQAQDQDEKYVTNHCVQETVLACNSQDERGDSTARDRDVKGGVSNVLCCAGMHSKMTSSAASAMRFIRKSKLFLALLLPCDFVTTFAFQSYLMFLVPYAMSVGFDQKSAVFIATMAGVGGVVTRFISGIVLRIHPTWCPRYYVLLSSISTVALFLQPMRASYGYLFACCFALGGTVYGCLGLIEPTLSMIVGAKLFPTAISILYTMKGVSSILACYLSGYLYDVTDSFRIVYYILGGLQGVGMVSMIALIAALRRRADRRERASHESAETGVVDADT